METFALSEPVLLVLLSLAEQPRHGYSILKDIESMSDGRVQAPDCINYRGDSFRSVYVSYLPAAG